jgi:diadenosine tetraphosphate (Ap4A) HIT family hydrolase
VFSLDLRLQQDTLVLGDFPLCRLLLSKDANYPWFILVPRQEGVSEVFDLDATQQRQLWQETSLLAEHVKASLGADKMNVATLGNVVSQLHMHVIARFKSDIAWPAPVWGKVAAVAYKEQQLAELKAGLLPLTAHGLVLA